MTDRQDGKWQRFLLKNRWYDDEFGNGATRGEVVENRLRGLDERFLKNDEEDISSREVAAFFDLFEDEPRS